MTVIIRVKLRIINNRIMDKGISEMGGRQTQGWYDGPEKRKHDAWEFKRTHFKLGGHGLIRNSQHKNTFVDHT